MLTESIQRLEMESTEDGVKVTIFYVHPYLDQPPVQTAELRITKQSLLAVHVDPSITSYMHEVGVMLGLREGDGKKNVNWQPMKEIPDDHPASKTPHNILAVTQAPGRFFWLATDYRTNTEESDD